MTNPFCESISANPNKKKSPKKGILSGYYWCKNLRGEWEMWEKNKSWWSLMGLDHYQNDDEMLKAGYKIGPRVEPPKDI